MELCGGAWFWLKSGSYFLRDPNGEPEWTLQMIANEVVSLELVESIARESVRRTLKKMNFLRT